jgi:hypothetical protein
MPAPDLNVECLALIAEDDPRRRPPQIRRPVRPARLVGSGDRIVEAGRTT